MWKKFVISAIFFMLVISSFSAIGIKIDSKTVKTENNLKSDPVDMNIADLIIDSTSTDASIELGDLVLDLNIPDSETVIPVTFNFNCKILNEKLLNTETWVFKIEMRKYPAEGYIINEEIVKDDVIIEGYPWEKTISTTVDFSRDYPWEEWGATGVYEQRYSLYIRCEYYDDGVEPGEQAPDDHAVETKNPVVVLENHDPPTKPAIISSDINNGDEVGAGTYDITVKSTDPNEDKILYTILWDDSTPSDDYGFVDSGTEHTFTHTYGEGPREGKDLDIEIFTKDEFGRMSDITTISFTLPKTKSIINYNLLETLRNNFPSLNNLIKDKF